MVASLPAASPTEVSVPDPTNPYSVPLPAEDPRPFLDLSGYGAPTNLLISSAPLILKELRAIRQLLERQESNSIMEEYHRLTRSHR